MLPVLSPSAQTRRDCLQPTGKTCPAAPSGFRTPAFCLGEVDTINVTSPIDFRLAKQQWGTFVQDSWKVTRKLTLDYGLRYDYSTYLKEEHGRLLDFSSTTPNPTAGGRPGAVIFEGSGPGRCSCDFAQNYPLALAPRIGLAYQINRQDRSSRRLGYRLLRHGRWQRSCEYVACHQPHRFTVFRPAGYALAEWYSGTPVAIHVAKL